MQLSDFDYDLPQELIAQRPPVNRSGGRLLLIDDHAEQGLGDSAISDLPEQLNSDDLLIFNDTRVFPARLFGQKESGGKVELLVERLVDSHTVVGHLRASKAPKAGVKLQFEGGATAIVQGREGGLFILNFEIEGAVLDLLEAHGHVPLPPYIQRGDDHSDIERYQTLFAREAGAVAAPTAGLHFDEALLDRLSGKGVALGYITLHVGAGTFLPVRVDDLDEHKMHAERFSVSPFLCEQIAETRKRGGRVIAVGTTVVRALEAASQSGELVAMSTETEIFIRPGYQFHGIDGLITNFHLPQSTLLMLVCAYGGYERMLKAYQHAVEQKYRFFSYGDAMLIWPAQNTDLP